MNAPMSPPAPQREFEALLDQHRGIVLKIAGTYTRRGADRDDLIQEICLQLWRAYPGYDPTRRFSTWMYRVALNSAISFVRAASVRERRTAPLDDPAASSIAAPWPSAQETDEVHMALEAQSERLYDHLRTLPAFDRALVLLYLEDRSYREIAEVLGISESNVGTRLNRLKQAMRRDLAPAVEVDRGAR